MAASNFTTLYNNGEWGYMGIGPMPAKSFTLTLKADSDHPIFTLGACDYTHIVAYNPNNTSQYAVYSGTSFTVYNNGGSFELVTIYGGGVNVPDEQTITIDYDPSKWDFHGLESLEGAALCIATNEYGYSPDSHDYASIATERKAMFWYEVNVIVMVDKINNCDIYAKRAELDANGNVISSLPASTSADEDKVLTVNSSGNAVWATPQGGGSTYTAGDGIEISAQDAISAKVGNGLGIGNASTTYTGSISADYAYLSASSLYILYGVADLNATLVNALSAGDVTFLVNKVYAQSSSEALVPIIYQKRYSSGTYIGYNTSQYILFSNPATIALDANHQTQANFAFTLNAANINSTGSTVTWATVQSDPTAYVVGLCKFANSAPVTNYMARCADTLTGTETRPIPTGTYSYATATVGRFINVTNPLPASAQADANKVLTVNSLGNPSWLDAPAELPSYSAADSNKVLSVNQNGGLGWGALWLNTGAFTWSGSSNCWVSSQSFAGQFLLNVLIRETTTGSLPTSVYITVGDSHNMGSTYTSPVVEVKNANVNIMARSVYFGVSYTYPLGICVYDASNDSPVTTGIEVSAFVTKVISV